jgi:outer membrane protein assembly factor BamB
MQADAPLGVPVVSGGIAYVVDDDGTVYAVGLGTGSKLWTLALGAPSEGSPPLVTDGSLVVGDASGGLHALDLSDGSPLWTQQLDAAIAGSPASSGRSIVLGTMGGTEYVLDGQSGSIRQQVTLPGPITRGTALSGDTAFVAAGGTLSSVSTLDGSVLWQTRVTHPEVEIGTPTVADGLVLTAVGIEGDDPAARAVVALDASTGVVRWRYASPKQEREFSPAVVDGRAYAVGKDGLVVALDALTGQVLWTEDSGGEMSALPAVVGDQVVVATDAGRVQSLATADGSERWSVSVVGQPHPMLVTGGLVLVTTTAGVLFALGDPAAIIVK